MSGYFTTSSPLYLRKRTKLGRVCVFGCGRFRMWASPALQSHNPRISISPPPNVETPDIGSSPAGVHRRRHRINDWIVSSDVYFGSGMDILRTSTDVRLTPESDIDR